MKTATRPDFSAVRRPTQPVRIAGIVFNHLVPVVSTIGFGGSVARFAVLTVFNVVFGIISVIGVNLVVSLLQKPLNPGATGWFRIEPWVSLCLVLGFFAAFFFGVFGFVTFAMIPGGTKILGDSGVWIGAGMMVLAVLPGMIATAVADRRAGLDENARLARDQPSVLLQVASGFALAILSIYAFDWFGAYALYALMIAITAFFIFRDLRPDVILRNFFPQPG